LFCNEVAANALMPLALMDQISNTVYNSFNDVFQTAKLFGVSAFALLVRAYNLKHISFHNYNRLKATADQEFKYFLQREVEKKAKQKEKKGGPDYYRLLVNKNSFLFTQVVLDAFRGGYIEPTQASRLLNTQVNNFSKLKWN